MSNWKIDDLLRESHSRYSPLQKLLRQAGNQTVWTETLRALLPPTLARDCRVTELKGPVLTIACRNASTATRLRFMTPDLLVALRDLGDFRLVQSIRVRVSLI